MERGHADLQVVVRHWDEIRDSDGCLIVLWELRASRSGRLLDFGVHDPRLEPEEHSC